MARRIKYRDAYGQEAVAIWNTVNEEWNVTLLRSMSSYTRTCKTERIIKVILDANGYGWTEVGRW